MALPPAVPGVGAGAVPGCAGRVHASHPRTAIGGFRTHARAHQRCCSWARGHCVTGGLATAACPPTHMHGVGNTASVRMRAGLCSDSTVRNMQRTLASEKNCFTRETAKSSTPTRFVKHPPTGMHLHCSSSCTDHTTAALQVLRNSRAAAQVMLKPPPYLFHHATFSAILSSCLHGSPQRSPQTHY